MRKRHVKKLTKAKSFYISKNDARLICANMQRFKKASQELWDECMALAIAEDFPLGKNKS